MLIVLFLVSHFNILFVSCGRLGWLPVSFLLHVKYTLSQFLLTAVSTTRRRDTSPPSSNRRATLVTGSVYACRRRPSSMFLAPNTWPSVAVRSVQLQLKYGTVYQGQCSLPKFRVTGHFSTPPENWTVRAFLQLTPRLSNDFTAAWLTFTFQQLFAVAATLKSIDYNVAMTFILNNNS